MKAFVIITVFYVFLTGLCIARPDKKIIKYHKLVNKAEVSICDNNYKAASKLYEDAFGLIDIPFAQDLYNASVCSINNKQYKKSLNYCEKLVLKGCEMSFFQKDTYKNLRNQKRLWAKFSKGYPALRQDFELRVNNKLIGELEKLIEADQNYYCEAPKRMSDNLFSDSLFANDSYIAKALTRYFEKYGYLSEEIIGANVKDTTLSEFPLFTVLIRHNYQKKHFDFTEYLQKAVDGGVLKPEIFCNWYAFQKGGFGYGDAFLVQQYNCKYYLSTYQNIREKMEADRASMNLPSLSDLRL